MTAMHCRRQMAAIRAATGTGTVRQTVCRASDEKRFQRNNDEIRLNAVAWGFQPEQCRSGPAVYLTMVPKINAILPECDWLLERCGGVAIRAGSDAAAVLWMCCLVTRACVSTRCRRIA